MKRIIVLCMVCMMLMSAVASAEIKKDKDETGLYVCSTIKRDIDGFTVQFKKNVVGDEVFYRISAYAHSKFREFLLKDEPISLLIDKYPAFYLDKYHYDVTKGYNEYYSGIVNAEVPLDLVGKIRGGESFLMV